MSCSITSTNDYYKGGATIKNMSAIFFLENCAHIKVISKKSGNNSNKNMRYVIAAKIYKPPSGLKSNTKMFQNDVINNIVMCSVLSLTRKMDMTRAEVIIEHP